MLHIFWSFLRLGCTAFGGPVAHLGYFHQTFVEKEKWLTDSDFADYVALCQTLPGPASSQVGISIGVHRGGWVGGLLAWLGFSLPSALLMVFCVLGLRDLGLHRHIGLLHGLKIAALAVVAHAVINMSKRLCTSPVHKTIAALSMVCVLLIPHPLNQLMVIMLAAIIGFCTVEAKFSLNVRWRSSHLALIVFALFLCIPISDWLGLEVFRIFYRTGAFVFGGGHVVLPLIQPEMVPRFLDQEVFLAGYGVAQALPGPLFAFSAYLGGNVSELGLWQGAGLALMGIYLPSFLLLIGVLPIWNLLKESQKVKGALAWVNAAVVGLLLAALYQPIFTETVQKVPDLAFAVLAFVALRFWKCPPWLLVLVCALIGLVKASFTG